MDREKIISDYLDCIIGKKVGGIGRASNMMWIWIDVEEGNPLSFDIQTDWRIINNKGKVEVGSYDIYLPNTKVKDFDTFEWDVQGQNLFDEKSQKWLKKNSEIRIKEYDVNELGDLKLFFDNGDRLEVISNCSGESEIWRALVKCIDREHLVFNGLGLEM